MADVSVSVGIEPDKPSIQKTEKAVVQSMNKAFSKIKSAASTVGKSISKSLRPGGGEGAKQVDGATESVNRLAQATQTLEQSTDQLGSQYSRVSNQVAAFGDAETNVRALGGAMAARLARLN
jgi:hypothetical protein